MAKIKKAKRGTKKADTPPPIPAADKWDKEAQKATQTPKKKHKKPQSYDRLQQKGINWR